MAGNDPIADLRKVWFSVQMRRTRLTWFAAGAACASLAAVTAELALGGPEPDQGWFLRIAEPVQSLHDEKNVALWQGAEIARDCGASHFEMIPGLAADAVDGTRIPLVQENNPATDCIIERAKEARLWFGVSLERLNLGS